MSNFIIAVVRSLVPIIVGWLVGLLAAINVHVAPDIEGGLIVSVSTLAASLYYVGAAWLERKYAWFGWLLGVARKPVYGEHAAA